MRWNSSGDMLASTGQSATVQLWDVKAEKAIHTGTDPEGSELLIMYLLFLIFSYFRSCLVCLFSLKTKQPKKQLTI